MESISEDTYGPVHRRFLALEEGKDAESDVSGERSLCVAQFNILASNLATPSHFPYVKEDLLAWERRRHILSEEIKAIVDSGGLDILCCEELSNYWDFWKYELGGAGFDSVFAKRPSITRSSWSGLEKHDGCGIFFRKDRFRVLRDKTIIFHDTHDRCALLIILHDLKLDVRYIIACTHLYWNATKEDVQMAELQEVESGVQQLISWMVEEKLVSSRTDVPIILCGDFNNGPKSSVYAHVTEKFGTICADWYCDDSHGDSSPTDLIPLRSAYDQYGTLSGVSTDDMEAPYTTVNYKRRWTIDYIFYTPSCLKVSGLYEIPPLGVLRSEDGPIGWEDRTGITGAGDHNGIPNSRFGSDHIPVAAIFHV